MSKKIIKNLIILAAIMLTLQGCALAIVGGIAAGSAAIFDRKALKTYYNDSNIEFAITQRLRKEKNLQKDTNIKVAVYMGIVLVVGQVPTAAERIQVQKTIVGMPGVKRIYNKLQISGPIAALVRTNDSLITGRVKSDMVFTKKLNSRYVKIITESGVVYLMGNVSSAQAALAANVARRVSGVQKVVTLFQIVN